MILSISKFRNTPPSPVKNLFEYLVMNTVIVRLEPEFWTNFWLEIARRKILDNIYNKNYIPH